MRIATTGTFALGALLLAACGAGSADEPRSITIDPRAPTTIDDLVASADLSPSDQSLFRVEWRVDDELAPDLTELVVPAVRTTRGERYRAQLIAYGLGQTPRVVAEDEVEIRNSLPRITRATLQPERPRADDTIRVQIGGPSDADGDEAEVIYAWYADGALISDAPSLPPGTLTPGQRIEVVVFADDGIEPGPEVRVEPVEVRAPFDADGRWALGPASTCFERADGTIWCWGYGFTIRTVIDEGPPAAPFAISHAMSPRAIASAQSTHLAVDREGTAWNWGWIQGVGPHVEPAVAVDRPGGAPIVDVAATSTACGCVVDSNGDTWCYGGANEAPFGPADGTGFAAWTQVLRTVALKRLEIGHAHGCGIDLDSRIWCFGLNARGVLGDPELAAARYNPVPAALPAGWRTLRAGFNHNCAIDDQRAAWCWGHNAFGALGTLLGTADQGPGQVAGRHRWLDVGVGQRYTCGLRDDDTVWCWGDNVNGTLGREWPAKSEHAVEVMVDAGQAWVSLGVGPTHACGERDDGSLWCWGRNGVGQLGDGTRVDSYTPVRVVFP